TLERAFNALSLATAAARSGSARADLPAHVEVAQLLGQQSRDAFRRLVYGDPAFYQFFQAVTPIDVIERMQIGSRSVHRSADADLSALLPVPWVFAWSQARYMLPGWYGAGSGLAAATRTVGAARVRETYDGWFFFRNLIDDVETMLARADLDIARFYEDLSPPALRHFGEAIRAEFRVACEQGLTLQGSRELLDSDPTPQRSIRLRNPYVDPMNLMQVDLLRRWRAGAREDQDLFAALLTSVAGIAEGLQSTG